LARVGSCSRIAARRSLHASISFAQLVETGTSCRASSLDGSGGGGGGG